MKTLAQKRQARADMRFGQKIDDALLVAYHQGKVRIPAHLAEAAAQVRAKRRAVA
jgi:hypothetical protein